MKYFLNKIFYKKETIKVQLYNFIENMANAKQNVQISKDTV